VFTRKHSRGVAAAWALAGDRFVALAIARPAPVRGQKQSRRAEAAHAWIWAKAMARPKLSRPLLAVDKARGHRFSPKARKKRRDLATPYFCQPVIAGVPLPNNPWSTRWHECWNV
jgi:hypothetical protein